MINRLASNPRQFARWIFALMLVPGVPIFADFVGKPSEPGNQFLFGLSQTRFVIGVLFAFLLLVNIGALLWVSYDPGGRKLERLLNRLHAYIPGFTLLLSVAIVFQGALLLGIIPPVIRTLIFLEPVTARLGGLLAWLFLAASLLFLWLRFTYRDVLQENKIVRNAERLLLLASLFLVTFFAYEHLLIWMGGANQSRYSYWNELADSFLQGHLYLQNPSQTHDLTFYNGKWYVPMPPIPAVLMMPLASIIGGQSINTSDFSILISAVNAVLVYLVLEQLVQRKWIALSLTGMLLLVLLFAFGTPHLWVGIRGRAWFVSQVVTVFFLALAVLGALKSWSPWLVGLCLGLAVMARPNGAMTWPFVFAIAMQILKEERGVVTVNDAFKWSLKSALPVVMTVAGLLLYNAARFDNPWDFGYATISGDPTVVANAQTYGIFSLHYIPANLKAMLLTVPALQPGERWPILPSTTGMSIFLATPPLIYLFHLYERRWWILGAWLAVAFNFVLLVLYHNTGAHQFGYRYILDAIVPLIAMLAVSLGRNIPWHFVLLLSLSIIFNIYGAYWFING